MGRSDKLQDVISGREVGQLKGRRLHLGSSLEFITMSDPFSPEGDPEVLFWPLTTSSALPCLQPALGYRFHSFHRPYVINNDNNNDNKGSDLFKLGANAPFILWADRSTNARERSTQKVKGLWAGENKSFLLFQSGFHSHTKSQPQTEIRGMKQAEWQPAGNLLKLRRSVALIGKNISPANHIMNKL